MISGPAVFAQGLLSMSAEDLPQAFDLDRRSGAV
jgi:hypothetical protein